MSLGQRLKALFGGGKAPARKVAVRSNTYLAGGGERAKVIAEAMAIYRRESAVMRKGLDQALDKLRAEVPKVLHDPEGLTRLLTLHRAHMRLRHLMTSDRKRFLALTGMRELLEDESAPAPAAKALPKPSKSRPKP